MSRGDALSCCLTLIATGVGWLVGGKTAAVICLIVGFGCFVLVHFFWKDETEVSVGNDEWQELAAKFEKLSPYIMAEKISGDTWRIWGWSGAPDCKAYCTLAGEYILKSPRVSNTLSMEVRTTPDATDRWLGFLAESGFVDDKQRITKLARVSFQMCIRCAAKEV